MAELQMLTREPVTVPENLESLSAQIIEQARTKLNYGREAERAQERAHGRLLRATLAKLDIEPFTPGSVARYQAAMVKPRWLVVTRMVVSMLAGFALVGTARVALLPGSAGVVGIVGFMLILACTAGAVVRLWAPAFQARWRQEDLRQTAVDVPLFALQTALAIKGEAPYALLHIERFVSRREAGQIRRAEAERLRQIRQEDPFLVVSYGDYTAYVEVWDEPGFEQRRKV